MFLAAPVWAVTYAPPFDKAILQLADWGAKGIELIGMRADTFVNYYTSATIRGLRGIMRDRGLILSNFNYSPMHLVSEDRTLREADIDTFRMAAETACALGAKLITSVSPYPFSLNEALPFQKRLPLCQIYAFDANLNRDWAGNYQLYVEQVRRCCEIAKEYGLYHLIEPHPYRYVNSAVAMLYLADKAQADNLRINVDTGHMFASGDMPECAIYQLGGLTAHYHIADNDTYTNAHWRPGMGKINWRNVLQAIHDIGYDFALSLELSDVPGFASRETPGTSAFCEQFRLASRYIQQVGEEVGIVFV